MGNIVSNSNLFCDLKCCKCLNVLDCHSDNGTNYLAYIIGNGKYSKKYYCLECLKNILKKKKK